MKKIKSIIVVLCSLAILSGTANARTLSYGNERERSKEILHRTAFVITEAHRTVNEHHVYTGDLARAIAHQHYARELYHSGEFLKAIYHSRRARALAVRAIEANHGIVPKDIGYTHEDEEFFRSAPPDNELDAHIRTAKPSEPMKDEDIIKLKIDVDL
jgi:hypothetical protein